MYLIDTSVWIDYLKNKNNQAIAAFEKIMSYGNPYGLTSVIYQETLQGASSQKIFQEIVAYLSTQLFFYPKDPISSYQSAAEFYFICRRKGITIRSPIDCLIAQIAIEHDLILLHNDRDFIQLNKIIPNLKLFPIKD